jgi:serine/threonine protein kinase
MSSSATRERFQRLAPAMAGDTGSMTVAPGTRLGSYEVLSPLGAGGVGKVYRAEDTRLGRASPAGHL